MAKLRITERKFNREGFGGAYPIEGEYIAHQEADIGSETKSNPVNEKTEYVSLFAETSCFIVIGPEATTTAADGSGEFLAMGERIQRPVAAGDVISVVAAA